MRPRQFDTQRVSNLRFGGKGPEKQPAVAQLRLAESVPEVRRQFAGNALQQVFAIGRAAVALLLLDDNATFERLNVTYEQIPTVTLSKPRLVFQAAKFIIFNSRENIK